MTQHVHAAGGGWLTTATASMAMMTAMMAPTVAPWVIAVHRLNWTSSSRLGRLTSAALFASGYFAVWSAFGLGLSAIDGVVDLPPAYRGAVLVGAGLFQLTALKQACLTHCRSPLSFLLQTWRDGPMSSMRLGLSHAAYCVGCCWALMLTSLAVGVTSLWWMAALMLTTLVEQVAPWGTRVRVPVGIVLIAAGVLSLF